MWHLLGTLDVVVPKCHSETTTYLKLSVEWILQIFLTFLRWDWETLLTYYHTVEGKVTEIWLRQRSKLYRRFSKMARESRFSEDFKVDLKTSAEFRRWPEPFRRLPKMTRTFPNIAEDDPKIYENLRKLPEVLIGRSANIFDSFPKITWCLYHTNFALCVINKYILLVPDQT